MGGMDAMLAALDRLLDASFDTVTADRAWWMDGSFGPFTRVWKWPSFGSMFGSGAISAEPVDLGLVWRY